MKLLCSLSPFAMVISCHGIEDWLDLVCWNKGKRQHFLYQGSCGSTLLYLKIITFKDFHLKLNDFLLTKINKLLLMYTILPYFKRKITIRLIRHGSILHAPSDNNNR